MAKSLTETSLGRAKPPLKIFLWYKLFKSLLISPILLVKACLKDSRMEQDSAHMATIVQLLLIPKLLYLPQKHCFSQSPHANMFQLKMSVKALHKNLKPCLFFHSEFVLAKLPWSQAETPPLRTKASQFDSINLSSSHKEMDKDANKPLSWHVT